MEGVSLVYDASVKHQRTVTTMGRLGDLGPAEVRLDRASRTGRATVRASRPGRTRSTLPRARFAPVLSVPARLHGAARPTGRTASQARRSSPTQRRLSALPLTPIAACSSEISLRWREPGPALRRVTR